MDVNVQTQKKIEEIKKMIKEQVSLGDIIKEKFSKSTPKKDAWLDRNNEFFNYDELDYLKYVAHAQIEEVKNFKENLEKVNIEKEQVFNFDNMLPTTFNTIEEIRSIEDRLKFLSSDEVIKFLFNMISSETLKKNVFSNSLEYHIENIKKQFSDDTVIKNIRISKKLYDKFTEICQKKNIKIINGLTCALYDFIESNK